MTSVATATSASPLKQQAAVAEAVKTNMDYNSFLRLFMAQMKNQDPTKPNDPTESLSQLASFSNVEQSIKLNGKLDSLLGTASSTLAADLVGKRITSLDGKTAGTVERVTSSQGTLTALLDSGQSLGLGDGYFVGAA